MWALVDPVELVITSSSSSSLASYFQFYEGLMYDDIRLHVAQSYTSSADSPFSFISSFTLSNHLLVGLPLFLAVAQLVECRTRNRESPGSNPRCYRFEVWAFSFPSRRLSRLSCINEYLAIDSGGNVSE